MEIFQLSYAVELAKHCNFSVAAEKLFITQPSLSLQIQNLERELGFSVFYRNKRVVRLTYAGEQFIKAATKVIKEYDVFKNDVVQINESLKRGVVFGTSTMSSVLVVKSISNFLKSFPQAEFRLVEVTDPDLVEMVLNHELDLAIVLMDDAVSYKDELVVVPIQECHICAVVMNYNRLAKQKYVTLKELEDEELVFSYSGSVTKALILNAFKECGCRPNSIMDIVSIEARVALIRDGAVSFSPDIQAIWGSEPNLVLVPILPKISELLAIIHPADQDLTFVENSFIDIICKDYKRDKPLIE